MGMRLPVEEGEDYKTKEIWTKVEVAQYLRMTSGAALGWINRMNLPRCPGSSRHVEPKNVLWALKNGPFPESRPKRVDAPAEPAQESQPQTQTKPDHAPLDTSFD